MIAFPKRCLPGAKVDLAGIGVTPALSDKRLFRWRGKGVGWSRKALLPFPARPQQRDPPIAREGVPSLKNRKARALRVPQHCSISYAELEGDGGAHRSTAGHLGSPKPWSWSKKRWEGEGRGEQR